MRVARGTVAAAALALASLLVLAALSGTVGLARVAGTEAAVRPASAPMAHPSPTLVAAQVGVNLRRPDVHFVPSPENVVEAMLNMAQVTARDVVYDLGSGDGRIPIAAATRFGARGVGVEIDSQLVARARKSAMRSGVTDRVTFLHQDLFEADLREATVVTLFLLQGINLKLMPKLQRELRPGSRVVSLNFTMGDAWPPDLSQDVQGLTVHMWTMR
jgi:SAM-dependent methyltransferase